MAKWLIKQKISLIGHRRKRPRTSSHPNFGKSIFWAADSLSVWCGLSCSLGYGFGFGFGLGPNPTSRSQASRIALEESETFYFIPFLSLFFLLCLGPAMPTTTANTAETLSIFVVGYAFMIA